MKPYEWKSKAGYDEPPARKDLTVVGPSLWGADANKPHRCPNCYRCSWSYTHPMADVPTWLWRLYMRSLRRCSECEAWVMGFWRTSRMYWFKDRRL